MLYTIAVILLIAWLLGFVGIYTVGPFVHVAIGGRDRALPRWAAQRAPRPGIATVEWRSSTRSAAMAEMCHTVRSRCVRPLRFRPQARSSARPHGWRFSSGWELGVGN